jgi:predicted transcriptional regulator
MARPKAKELTERELEIMHLFWRDGQMTCQQVRDGLAEGGRDLAYTTVATLVRILEEKRFLKQTNDQRPYRYLPVRTFEEVSSSMLSGLIDKVFGGSREALLARLMDERKLTVKERAAIEKILREER